MLYIKTDLEFHIKDTICNIKIIDTIKIKKKNIVVDFFNNLSTLLGYFHLNCKHILKESIIVNAKMANT